MIVGGEIGGGTGGGGGNGGGGEAGTKKFVIPAVPFDELESSKLLLSELPFRLALPLELALELVGECCSGSLRRNFLPYPAGIRLASKIDGSCAGG